MWVLAAVAIAGLAVWVPTTPNFAVWKEYLVSGPLGKSGFLAAFSLILLSEIGDKTFFIAAILAMKVGRMTSFVASLSALALMSVISVAIGTIFSKVPDALKSSVPVGEIAGIVLLIFFGLRTLKEGLAAEDGAMDKSEEEMSDAEEVVMQAEQDGLRRGNPGAFLEVATLIFIAEWGDRSMLATIALGAAQNPFGVAAGAVVGHAIATGVAVLGGAIAAKYVSEKTVNIISGSLFLIFAVATAFSML